MDATARDSNQIQPADTNGLDDLFVAPDIDPDKLDRTDTSPDAEPVRSDKTPDTNPAAYWTPVDAAKYYGVSVRTIRRRLQERTLQGYKFTGTNGPEWRIAPVIQVDFNPDKLDRSDTSQDAKPVRSDSPDIDPDNVDSEPVNPDTYPLSDPVVSALLKRVADVESQLAKTQSELQGAVWRNGYLEAQVESKDLEITKLLTDSQHKPTLWTKFKSWFLGAP